MAGRVELGKYLRKAVEIIKLRKEAAEEAANDEAALLPGILILAIGGLAVAIGAMLQGIVREPVEAAFFIFFAPILNVLIFSLFISVFHAIARLFGGKASFQAYYRAAALASIVSWVQIVPVVGTVLSIWTLPVNVIVLEGVHKLRRIEAVAVVSLMMAAAMSLLYFSGLLG
ncbi:MAG TPA: YIP1 family protein [Thermodesulfobacteriota bacterium]